MDPSMLLENWIIDFPTPNPTNKEHFIRMAITGPSDSGKSYMFKYIFQKFLGKQYELVVIFCGSKDTLKEYKQLTGSKFCFETYNAEFIHLLKKQQHNLIKQGKLPLRILIIYDDFSNRKNKGDLEVFNLAIQGRHDCISFIMILHDLITLDRIVLDQMTHIITTRQMSANVFEKLAHQYLATLIENDPKFNKHFIHSKKSDIIKYISKIFHNNTNNYNCIVILLERYKKQVNQVHFSDIVKRIKAGPLSKPKEEPKGIMDVFEMYKED